MATSGGSLLGLLGGLLDGDGGAAELAAAIREVLAFADADHRWSIGVTVKHNPRRSDDPHEVS